MIFDKSLAALLSSASQTAYDFNTLPTWGTDRHLQPPQPFSTGDTQGFSAGDENTLAIVFRGTEPKNLRDWQTDAQAVRIPSAAGGFVHRGFSQALDLVWPKIESILKQREQRQLLIAGHSLGGALAVLAASRLPGIPLKLYTFGQPRVGNEDFAKSCDGLFGSNYFRFVNNKDIVPRLPPFSAGYRHFGHELFIDARGNINEIDSGVETLEDALRAAAGSAIVIPKAISDVMEPLLGAVDSVGRGKVDSQSAIAAINGLLSFFSLIPGGGVKGFLDAIKSQTTMLDEIRKHPGALQQIADHDSGLYVRAIARA